MPPASPLDKLALTWRLMSLLPALTGDAVFAPVAGFLGDGDASRRLQLAQRLADLFDQYQVYRADWLGDWAAGEDVIATSRQGRIAVPEVLCWQPRLWRALLEDVGPESGAGGRAERSQRGGAVARENSRHSE